MGCNPVELFLPGVTRMPISGPAPYNTLVCCTFGGFSFLGAGGPGYVTRSKASLMSNFVLAGFDQRNPPQYEHSTSAWIPVVGPGTGNDTWLYAVDDIAGAGFDPVTGQFFVTLDVASMSPHIPSQLWQGLLLYFTYVCVCSYILVYEPPPPGSGHRYGPFRRPTPYAHPLPPAAQGNLGATEPTPGTTFRFAAQMSRQAESPKGKDGN